MDEKEVKLPEKTTPGPISGGGLLDWHPFESLRRQVDRLFDEFPTRRGLPDFEPFERFVFGSGTTPPVDFVEKDGEYEITAELPGLDEKSVEVKLSNGVLTIGGEKKDEREEKDKEKGYYFSERRYGSFKRAFRMPEGVDAEKIAASFDKGVLTVKLPKTAEALKSEKKIAVTSK